MSEEATPALPEPTPATGRVLRGFGYGAAANGLAIVAGFLTMGLLVGYIVLLGFGVVQLAWITPMYLKYKRIRREGDGKGHPDRGRHYDPAAGRMLRVRRDIAADPVT